MGLLYYFGVVKSTAREDRIYQFSNDLFGVILLAIYVMCF